MNLKGHEPRRLFGMNKKKIHLNWRTLTTKANSEAEKEMLIAPNKPKERNLRVKIKGKVTLIVY